MWTHGGTNLPGATNASLVLPHVSTNDAGVYCAIVQGACNRVTNCAVLNVVPVAPVNLSCVISHWKFDEASGLTALDSAGANPGALVNNPARVPGQFGGALQFNGVNQIVNVPNSASLNVPQRFSMSPWFRPGQNLNAFSGRKDLFKKFLSYWLILNYPSNDGKLSFVLNSGGSLVRSTTSSWSSNQWYHVVAAHDGVTMKLYINGALEGSTVVGVSAAPSTYPVQIGGNTTQGYWFPGAIDDVRLYGNPLAADAVTALYNGLSPLLPQGGLVTIPSTLAISIEPEFDRVVLKWSAQTGRNYRVEYTEELSTAEWSPLPGDVTVSGSSASAEDTLGLSTQRFYRVVAER